MTTSFYEMLWYETLHETLRFGWAESESGESRRSGCFSVDASNHFLCCPHRRILHCAGDEDVAKRRRTIVMTTTTSCEISERGGGGWVVVAAATGSGLGG
ncbi:hypothetical protein Droror1_Dr00017864 [Drosera rotundifolia]